MVFLNISDQAISDLPSMSVPLSRCPFVPILKASFFISVSGYWVF